MSNDEPPIIDATSEPIESADSQPQDIAPGTDPALAITVALANELQTIYANDHSKLETANRSLRRAIHPKQ